MHPAVHSGADSSVLLVVFGVMLLLGLLMMITQGGRAWIAFIFRASFGETAWWTVGVALICTVASFFIFVERELIWDAVYGSLLVCFFTYTISSYAHRGWRKRRND